MIRTEQLNLIFEFGTMSSKTVMMRLGEILLKNHVSPLDFVLNGAKPASLSAVVRRIENTGESHFHVVGQGYQFDLSPIRNFQIDMLQIAQSTDSPIPWDEWAVQFIGNPDFVMAWVVDSDYDHWQNAEDTLEYISAKKPYNHLRTKSNGLPYPLQQNVIDTSANPAVRRLKLGYVEAIGAVMWLGDRFWRLTSREKCQLEDFPWLHVSAPLPGITRVQAAEQCFTSETATSDLQAALRAALFQKGK